MRPSESSRPSRPWRYAVVGCVALLAACGEPAGDSGTTTGPVTTTTVVPVPSLRYGTVPPVVPLTVVTVPPPSLRYDTVPPVVGAGAASDAALFVCETIATLRADFAGIEDDLTAAGWVNGFIAALGNAPDESVYSDVVTGGADTAAAALCPDDWAEYLSRAEISTLQGIDVAGLATG